MADFLEQPPSLGSGSYAPDDVHFLLQPMQMAVTDVQEKERLIQTSQKHYSEMISQEQVPSPMHMALYRRALQQNGSRLAADVQALALALDEHYQGPSIALVSFVRAGLPLGVLLKRALQDLGREVQHYGISIIRDRGIDRLALDAIVKRHGAENMAFVDGWTGKGAISTELEQSLSTDPRFSGPPRLVVLADPCGRAWLAASAEDWVIPSGILGATVSGLISRSIWPDQGGLHGCVVYEHLRDHDVTREFIEQIEAERRQLGPQLPACPWTALQGQQLQTEAEQVIQRLAKRFAIHNLNRLKPGIAEATRAVLRRVPERVLVRDRHDSDVQLLMHLTESTGLEVQEAGAELGPYRAITVIRSLRR